MNTLKWIVNPYAGGGRGKRLIKTLKTQNLPTLRTTLSHFNKQVAAFVKKGDTLIIAGGDGTFHLVINTLISCQLIQSVTLATYPLGTGNDLARSLNMPKGLSPSDFMHTLENTHLTELPLFEINGFCFTNYLSIGFDATVNHAVEHFRQKIKINNRVLTYLLYLVIACRYLTYKIPPSINIQLDDRPLSIDCAYAIIFSNIPSYAGGARLLKNTKDTPSDHLKVFVLTSPFEYLKLMLSRFKYFKFKDSYKLCKNATLTMPATPVQLDGENKTFSNSQIKAINTLKIHHRKHQ